MKNTYQIAAEQLLKNRIKAPKKVRLAAELRPQNSEQALHIQTETIKLRSDEVVGWKCSLPLNEEQLIVAPLFSDTVQSGQQCGLFSENEKARIEPEIAFILGADLPASTTGYSEAEIDAAVDRCHMALELMQDRFSGQSGISFYEKLADCLVNQGVFIGPEIDKSSTYLANEFMIRFNQGDNKQRFSGIHPNKLPQNPLHWLINYMTQRGVNFTAGQAIITGSYAGVVEVDFNCLTEIEYEALGKYQVTFIEKSV
jgi:2-keto-4-pentenoate hydratase